MEGERNTGNREASLPAAGLLNVRSLGKGGGHFALVIVHGLFGSGDNWMSLARRFSEHMKVYLVDLPNHGESPWTDTAAYPAMAQMLFHTLDGLAAGEQSPPQYLLLGHSMGGKTVMGLALEYDRLRADRPGISWELAGLVVADIAPKTYPPGHEEYFAAMEEVDLSSLTSRSDADRSLSRRIASAPLRAFLLKNLVRDSQGAFGWRINLDILIRDYDEIRGWPYNPEMRAAVPVLFLRGTNSDYIRLQEDRDSLWGHFPRARVEEIPDAGHWLHAEQPELVYTSIAGFIQTLDPGN